jgi:hypothetical protein
MSHLHLSLFVILSLLNCFLVAAQIKKYIFFGCPNQEVNFLVAAQIKKYVPPLPLPFLPSVPAEVLSQFFLVAAQIKK